MHVSRLRSQAGVTLIELLVAMSIGLVTVFAAIALLEIAQKQSVATAARVNATQRGRITMDTMTRELRSQVCYSPTVPALVSGSDDDVKFYADLSDGTRPIEQRELLFDPVAQTIVERTWAGVGTPVTFPTMTRSRQLLSEVTRRAAPNAATFRYYAYNTAVPPRPDTLLTTPLNATDLARVAKIDMGYTTLPPKGGLASAGVTLQNEIYVRVADPNDPAPTPTCA
jgi:prepilin-type N-terminal cleavage/methylation domain-containing protein